VDFEVEGQLFRFHRHNCTTVWMNLRALWRHFGTGRPLRVAVVCLSVAMTAIFFKRQSAEKLSVGFAAASGAFAQQVADDQEIVGKRRGGNEQSEALGAFGATTLHAAAAHQH
jgi:hypothetical protein